MALSFSQSQAQSNSTLGLEPTSASVSWQKKLQPRAMPTSSLKLELRCSLNQRLRLLTIHTYQFRRICSILGVAYNCYHNER